MRATTTPSRTISAAHPGVEAPSGLYLRSTGSARACERRQANPQRDAERRVHYAAMAENPHEGRRGAVVEATHWERRPRGRAACARITVLIARAIAWPSGRKASLQTTAPRFGMRTETRHLIALIAPAAILAPALLMAALLAGCSPGLAGIDREASKIISARTEALGGNAIAPTYEHLDPVRAQADEIRHTDQNTESFPETRNPAASELSIERADPRRTVQALLDRYKDTEPTMQRFTLEQTLKYAVEHAREYKTAKEELLLAALRLLTQRHLFGPRFFDEVTASFDGDPEDGDYEIATRLVNEFA
jgi:hypothetical protein